MPDYGLKQIMAALPRLSHAELQKVKAQASALLGLPGKAGGAKAKAEEIMSSGGDWLLDGIISVLRGRGLGKSIPPYTILKKSPDFLGYVAKGERVRGVFEEAIPNMTPPERVLLGQLLAATLCEYLLEWTTCDLSSMLRFADRTIEAAERAYPGYLAAGMYPWLLKRNRFAREE